MPNKHDPNKISKHYVRPPYPYMTAESLCVLCGQPQQSNIHIQTPPSKVRRGQQG